MPPKNRIAIVHDWLPLIGGAERVLEVIHSVYPAPIYTLIKNDESLKGSYFEGKEIHTSFIAKLPFAKSKYRSYLPFFPLAVEQFDLREYDTVISSSYAVAKGILTSSNQLHICYCHSPIRYAWDLYHQYLEESGLNKGFKSLIARAVLHYIRNWDVSSSNRVDYYIANSEYIAKRIKKIYNRDAQVIYPPVAVDEFELYENKEEFYFTASRMVPYKRIDLIVDAFVKMPHKTLVVIGDGPDYEKIKKRATANVKVLGYQPFEVLKDYMKRAKAFVFAAEEDFGIIPVEAQACGTPVIAYGKGGALETVVHNHTGILFNEQSTSSIINAVSKLEANYYKFNFKEIRAHAEKFNKERFICEFKKFVEEKQSLLKREEEVIL